MPISNKLYCKDLLLVPGCRKRSRTDMFSFCNFIMLEFRRYESGSFMPKILTSSTRSRNESIWRPGDAGSFNGRVDDEGEQYSDSTPCPVWNGTGILQEQRHRLVAGGVVHSFTGTQAELDQYLSLGLHIGKSDRRSCEEWHDDSSVFSAVTQVSMDAA